MRRRAGARRERDAIRLAAALQAAACPFRLQSPNGQAYADTPEPTDLRRMRGRIGRRRRHGRQGADRGRRERRHARSRADVGSRRATRRCSRGPTIRRAAAARFPSGSSASSTPHSAAGRSTASRTRNAPGDTWDWFRSRMLGGRTNHWGRISLRFGPYDFQRKTLDGLGDDWPITLRRHEAVLRQGRPADRHLRLDGEPAERAGRHLSAAAEAALLRAADQGGGREAEHPGHPVAAVDPDPAAQRPARVPLLRPVRPRLPDALEFLVAVGPAAAGAWRPAG